MIRFFRTAGCPGCQYIQEMLEELCIAHEVVTVTDDQKEQYLLSAGRKPPVLVENDQIFEGYYAIVDYLDELEGFARLWRKFQSDTCYCDEKGAVE